MLRAAFCWAVITIAAAAPAFGQGGTSEGLFECKLYGPDSVRFVGNGFVPDQFYLGVSLRNTGTERINNVSLYLLQSRRFTLLSAQSRFINSIPADSTVELLGPDGFQLITNPDDIPGFDTLFVLVDGEGIRGTCILPVYVEKETRPRLELYCESTPALVFDETLNDYVPNPFPVKTILRNVGDGAAENCSINYTGPSRVSPADGEINIAIGRLEAGTAFSYTWQMKPKRRDSGGLEDLPFFAQGEGGYRSRIVSTECSTATFIPAARAANYICTLDVDEVRYDQAGKRYSPDPFMFRAKVSNVGQGIAVGMTMLTTLESGLLLAQGQSLVDTLTEALGPGETSGIFSKSLRPLLRRTGDSLRISVLFSDRFGDTVRCEKMVWIPPADESSLLLQCSSELDSLLGDVSEGGYQKSSFSFNAEIGNLSSEAVFNVSLVAVVDPEGVLVIDKKSQEKQIALALLQTDGMRKGVWTVQALPSTVDRIVHLRVFANARTAAGYYLPLISCEVPVFIPHVGRAHLQCGLSTDVTNGSDDMVVGFDTARVNYEGIPSRFGDYTVFRLTADVSNTGDAVASPVTATLLLPPGIRFEEDEQPTKTISPSRLAVGEHGTASWLLQPLFTSSAKTLDIEVLVSTEQATPSKCDLKLTLAEVLNVVEVSIPSDLTGVSAGILTVPINIGATPNIDPGSYRLLLRFDPGVLRFVEARSDNSLTAYSWRNLNTQLFPETMQSGLNILMIADSTDFAPQKSNEGGPLLHLFFEILHQSVQLGSLGYVIQSPLQFVRYPSIMADGTSLAPFLHSYGGEGGFVAVYRDGVATLSGDCVLPLSASTRLLPNQPNPFNPVTLLRYYLAENTAYRIVVLDAFGRFVRLVEEGSRAQGSYSVLFDAGELPSGLYFCRIETPQATHTRRILLTK
ncbi:MAG: T9SS type A sorting domain-containing protein [Bacteroidota bacterium]